MTPPAARATPARATRSAGRCRTARLAALEELDPARSRADPATLLAGAQRLLDAGRPFQAHELLEAAWKRAPEGERQLWRALAQLAVGVTHALRGNATGAARSPAAPLPSSRRGRPGTAPVRHRRRQAWPPAPRELAKTQQPQAIGCYADRTRRPGSAPGRRARGRRRSRCDGGEAPASSSGISSCEVSEKTTLDATRARRR